MKIYEEKIDLVSPLGEAKLVNFKSNDEIIGYAIIVDDILVELSEGSSPYTDIAINPEVEEYYYDMANYGKITKKDSANIVVGDFSTSVPVPSLMKYPSDSVLTGVSPQLQNNSNCIAAALSNVIWYWGSNFTVYNALINGKSFADLRTIIQNLFFGTFANNSVLSVANTYAGNYSSGFTGGANWSPTFSTVQAEIYSYSSPCMVGFAAGSSYSPDVGHMTMCYGYTVNIYGNYLILADGHQSYPVLKLWTAYNDCVIQLHIY